jgi:hypothetical protein
VPGWAAAACIAEVEIVIVATSDCWGAIRRRCLYRWRIHHAVLASAHSEPTCDARRFGGVGSPSRRARFAAAITHRPHTRAKLAYFEHDGWPWGTRRICSVFPKSRKIVN